MSNSQRATSEIMMDLLAAIDEQRPVGKHEDTITATKRSLMRAANVNYEQLVRYIDRLEDRSFINRLDENGSLTLAITVKGQLALENSAGGRVDRSLLRKADREILSVLEEGRNTAANIASATDSNRQFVYNRLRWLVDQGFVENVGNGVFEFTAVEASQVDSPTA